MDLNGLLRNSKNFSSKFRSNGTTLLIFQQVYTGIDLMSLSQILISFSRENRCALYQ